VSFYAVIFDRTYYILAFRTGQSDNPIWSYSCLLWSRSAIWNRFVSENCLFCGLIDFFPTKTNLIRSNLVSSMQKKSIWFSSSSVASNWVLKDCKSSLVFICKVPVFTLLILADVSFDFSFAMIDLIIRRTGFLLREEFRASVAELISFLKNQ